MSFLRSAVLLLPFVYFGLNFLVAMAHQLELGLGDGTRVRLVIPLHEEVPTILLHPVMACRGIDANSLLTDL